MAECLSKRVKKNTVRKGEIARYEQFLLFPQCFKILALQTSKMQGLFRKGISPFSNSESNKTSDWLEPHGITNQMVDYLQFSKTLENKTRIFFLKMISEYGYKSSISYKTF